MKPQLCLSKGNPRLITAPCVLEWYEYLAKDYAESGSAMRAGMWAAKARNMRSADINEADGVYDESLWEEINRRTDNGEAIRA